jgi:hypothetical protein
VAFEVVPNCMYFLKWMSVIVSYRASKVRHGASICQPQKFLCGLPRPPSSFRCFLGLQGERWSPGPASSTSAQRM